MPTRRKVAATARPPMPAPTTAMDSFLLFGISAYLLLLDAGFLDHVGPLRDVRLQQRHQFVRRARFRHHAEIEEAGLEVGPGKNLGERLVEDRDHLGGAARRR